MSTTPDVYQKMLITSGVVAGAFTYFNLLPGGGIDLDPALFAGLQAAVGSIAGMVVAMLFYPSEIPGGSKGVLSNFFGPGGRETRMLALQTGVVGLVSYLLFPDNTMLRAGLVFFLPIMKDYASWPNTFQKPTA